MICVLFVGVCEISSHHHHHHVFPLLHLLLRLLPNSGEFVLCAKTDLSFSHLLVCES